MSDPTWDTSKENFQPLKRGRDAKMLDQVTGMANGERATKIKEERRYEATPERTPPPLWIWCSESDWSILEDLANSPRPSFFPQRLLERYRHIRR